MRHSPRVLICVGTGGVGKTTVASALALGAALEGSRALAVTIDPARRLRSLLRLDEGPGEHRVPVRAKGEFWAAVLDVEHTLEQAVRTYGTRRQVETVLQHPIYRMLVSSLAGMQELMAVEYLGQALRRDFDTIVVDTAPSRHAFEFLDKPEFFADLVSLPLVRVVGGSYRLWADSPLGRLGRRTFDVYSKLEDLVGAGVVGQVLDFYSVFRSIAEGYAERARASARMLRDPRTCGFHVVTVPSKALLDGEYFLKELSRRGYTVDGLIVNRVWKAVELRPEPFGEAEREVLGWYRSVSREHEDLWARLESRLGSEMELRQIPEMERTTAGLPLVEALSEALSAPSIPEGSPQGGPSTSQDREGTRH
jgi:anion-transporting  ArsA/GET3 family ATPase